jgi:chromosome segregation ATPase
MDQDPRSPGTPVDGSAAIRADSGDDAPRSPAEIRADIEQTRKEVGDTVEALAEKTDVKARANDRVEEVKDSVRAKADEVKSKADELKSKAQSTTPESAQRSGQQVIDRIRANPVPFIAAGAVVLVFLLGRRSARP